MKRFLSVALLACSLVAVSCNTYNNSTDDDWIYGKGNEYEPKTKVEQNLISQFCTYSAAFSMGNTNEMKRFFYMDAIEYYKQYFPGLNDEEVLDEFFKMMTGDAMNTLYALKDEGIDLSIYVEDVTNRIESGDEYLYVFDARYRVSRVLDDTLRYLHSPFFDKVLAVSHNKGRNWSFINMIEEMPTILLMNYPQSIVDDVMKY
ncbi:MAG: hypothetical protein J6Y52_05525 [Bacteroidales bacterium]|nr:hypothetical protein [Bacteroidales bacterium]